MAEFILEVETNADKTRVYVRVEWSARTPAETPDWYRAYHMADKHADEACGPDREANLMFYWDRGDWGVFEFDTAWADWGWYSEECGGSEDWETADADAPASDATDRWQEAYEACEDSLNPANW